MMERLRLRVTVRLAADATWRQMTWTGRGNPKSGLENLEKRSAWKAPCHTHIQPQWRLRGRCWTTTGRENLVRIAESNLIHLVGGRDSVLPRSRFPSNQAARPCKRTEMNVYRASLDLIRKRRPLWNLSG